MKEWIQWFLPIAAGVLITSFIFATWFAIISHRIVYEYKWRFLKALLIQEQEWYDGQEIEKLPSKLNSCINDIENATGFRTSAFIWLSFSACISGLALCYYFTPIYATCLLVIVPIIVLLGQIQSSFFHKKAEEETNSYLASASDAEQALNAIKIVKAFGQENYEANKFEDHSSLSNLNKRCVKYAFTFGITELVYYTTLTYAFIVGSILYLNPQWFFADKNWGKDSTVGIMELVLCCWSMRDIGIFSSICLQCFHTYKRGLVGWAKLLPLINRIPKIQIDEPESILFNSQNVEIEFRDVTFTYKDGCLANDKLSFRIEAGKKTAIIGPSGAGKSTIAKLLMRLYEPDSGEIYICGINLKSLNLRSYRRKVGYVGQEPCLLNDSIRNNMLFSNPEASESDIMNVLDTVEATHFIKELPSGIDTQVGSIGGKFSGGQKQRLAIARALICKPDILIFDEATSALDHESEQTVQMAIEKLDNLGITQIMIAHRLTTVMYADHIIALENGKVVEQGSHNQLVMNNGLYSTLLKTQDLSDTENMNMQKIEDTGAVLERMSFSGSFNPDHDTSSVLQSRVEELTCSETDSLWNYNNMNQRDIECLQDAKKIKPMSYWEILTQLWHHHKSKWSIILILSGTIFLALLFVITLLVQIKIQLYFVGDINSSVRDKILAGLGIAIIVSLLVWLVQTIIKYFTLKVSIQTVNSVRSRIYHNLVRQPFEFFHKEENSTGVLTALLSTDIDTLSSVSIENYLHLYYGFMIYCIGAVFISYLDWKIGLLCLGALLLNSLIVFTQSKEETKMTNEKKEQLNRQRKNTTDFVLNHITVASLANEDLIVQNFTDSSGQDLGSTLKLSVLYAILSWFNFFLFYFAYTLWANHVEEIGYERGTLAYGLTLGCSITLTTILLKIPDFGKSKNSASKILRLEQIPAEGSPNSDILNGEIELTPDIASGNISFRNVWFRYSNTSKWILKDANLLIRAGETIGVVGESGWGKTTLMQLLLRFYQPEKGTITISGVPIQQFTIRSLRSSFGLVQQEPCLFNSSIMENIWYGKPHASAEEITEATEIAHAHEFITSFESQVAEDDILQYDSNSDDPRFSKLPDGYKVLCGSGGSRLSGGQKQRVAIARAVIRKPSILLLDEATSALDEISQRLVQDSLDTITKRCTSITIAHRLTTLNNWNRIIRLKEAKFVEDSKDVKLTESFIW